MSRIVWISSCQELGWGVEFVRNTCSFQAFSLRFKWYLKTDSFLLIKTWELMIGLAYCLLHYGIITFLKCKTDLMFIAYSQRSHYIQSSVIFWAASVKLVSLNVFIGLKLMLSLCTESSISFCVIMLLLWFDFLRNIPCLYYSIRSSPRDTVEKIVSKLTWNILLAGIHLT